MSVKRRSRILASCFLAKSRTVLASDMRTPYGKSPHFSRKGHARNGAPGRLLQSVALRRTGECKGCGCGWQFDSSYGGDNATLYSVCGEHGFGKGTSSTRADEA